MNTHDMCYPQGMNPNVVLVTTRKLSGVCEKKSELIMKKEQSDAKGGSESEQSKWRNWQREKTQDGMKEKMNWVGRETQALINMWRYSWNDSDGICCTVAVFAEVNAIYL